ncbi:hypothetical protein [Nocardioides euryhalodurans]|uniref:Uncharacterized protein n=1 Tax=Nocardioides euryhalodurans TaxID=2518370 RepID=A0A4P7GNH7_9ACTN|nr:hypothetical protein [Nocardioides euryhalodurans]QBR93768.1 hypothetical protein EXE57_16905 [Nocardioides euryhalodurans]
MCKPDQQPDGVPVDPVTGLPALTLGVPITSADVDQAIADDETMETFVVGRPAPRTSRPARHLGWCSEVEAKRARDAD